MNFLIAVFNWFVKLTGWLVQKIIFRTKIYYVDKKRQSRRIKGAAIIMSNHTAVYDYAAFLFVFMSRTLRYQMAEVLYKKRGLGGFLKAMGGIYVDRDSHNFGFVRKSEELLKQGKVVGVFPESKVEDRPGELLPFKPSVSMLALNSGAPIIPLFTDGNYFGKGRARVIIGTPIYVRDLYDETKSEKENITVITQILQDKISQLGKQLDEKQRKKR